MDVRQATTDDVTGIRTVARRSLEASYDFLAQSILDDAVDQWYDDEALEGSIADSEDVLLVGTVDGEVVAFSQNAIIGENPTVGEIRWLHVDPDRRGQGIGDELLRRTREVLRGQGAGRIRGVVLGGNEAGSQFYEDHGFELQAERPVDIGDQQYQELIFETGAKSVHGEESPGPEIEPVQVEDREMYLFRDEAESGSEGPFHPVYTDRDRENLYTWHCGVCGTTDNAMDAMGRLECNECGNVLKPTRWDAAYL